MSNLTKGENMFDKKHAKQNKEIHAYGMSIVRGCNSYGELESRIAARFPGLSRERLRARAAKVLRVARGKGWIDF